MNTFRIPRARPRVGSFSYRAFFWALKIEAAYQVTNRARAFHALGPIGRDRVPMDRTGIFVARALKLARLNSSLRSV